MSLRGFLSEKEFQEYSFSQFKEFMETTTKDDNDLGEKLEDYIGNIEKLKRIIEMKNVKIFTLLCIGGLFFDMLLDAGKESLMLMEIRETIGTDVLEQYERWIKEKDQDDAL